jgi:hypothetical protein
LTVEKCLEKAKRNKSFIFQYLMPIIRYCPEWTSVVAFYSALHFVDAYLLRRHNIQREHHDERETEVAFHMTEIYPAYKRLFELGFRSRYRSVQDNPTEEEADSTVKYDLRDVENFVMERM